MTRTAANTSSRRAATRRRWGRSFPTTLSLPPLTLQAVDPASRPPVHGTFGRWAARTFLPHALAVSAVLAAVHLSLPVFWGSPGLDFKVRHVVEWMPTYDRVFIGSSHLFRQVMPHVLDSALGDGKRSFNMALAAVYSPEAEIACEQVLRGPHPPPEVYLELMPFVVFEQRSFDHYRSWYYMDAPTTATLLRHDATLRGVRPIARLEHIGNDLRAFAYAATKPGLQDRFLGDGRTLDTASVMGPLGDGHLPFEWQQTHDPRGKGLRARAEALAADTGVIAERARAIARVHQGASSSAMSTVHKARIERLIRLADDRGVRLRFVLPPLWPVREEVVVGLLAAIPEDRRIDLSDPARFPEFYRMENIFDAGHLNARGARLFTLRLADRLRADRLAHTSIEPGAMPTATRPIH